MIVDAEGKVEQRVVQVSRTIGDRWLVESGLQAGDKVILEGLQKVAPGAAVQASEAVAEQKSEPVESEPVESIGGKDTAADAAEAVPVSAADES
jgi:membrane fusion protein (multidrug efflux system)